MALSDMMKQYLKLKDQYKDCILFFRLGDFYEMFFDDAVTASRELDLTLTGRDCGLPERAPMCGVPYHAVETYLSTLIEKGYKVAICEQLTDPTKGRGIVERDVVRVVTPGTVIDGSMLPDDKNVYLVSICYDGTEAGVSWLDMSTGEFNHLHIDSQIKIRLNELLSRIDPAEIICNEEMLAFSIELSMVKFGALCPFRTFSESAYQYDNALRVLKEQLPPHSVEIVGNSQVCVRAAGALLEYVRQTQKRSLGHISESNAEETEKYMSIDPIVRRTLELTQSSGDGKKRGSLLWLIDKTATSMGARLLRKWVEQPSYDETVINDRLNAVGELKDKTAMCDRLREAFKQVYDIERLAGRLSYGNMSPPDCLALAKSFAAIPQILPVLETCESSLLHGFCKTIVDFSADADMIFHAIAERAPVITRDGGIIRDGYDSVLDEYRKISGNAIDVIKDMEENERRLTGIKTLKIKNNKVFGYFIEVSNSQTGQVPYRYIRKQTIAGGERYYTEELKELEEKIVNATTNSIARELELYEALLLKLKTNLLAYISTAQSIAYLDCLVSGAVLARENQYVKPTIGHDVQHLKIVEGRHPVVEKLLRNEQFVPNDTFLDNGENRIMLITGPNMAGKSIYMRQVAIITLMAHIGYFVPAARAEIPMIDKIFTRVGASDDIATSRSTFMVEMSEMSYILENVTDRSLVLLDEIGRGTSTYDGLSIAWAIIEYMSQNNKAMVLFSTHYHELTELEGVLDGIKNYKLTVREIGDTIVFLRKLMRGSANRSFGIEVAGLAGLPQNVLKRAKELLKQLEASDIGRKTQMSSGQQISIFNVPETNEIARILRDLDMDTVSPRNAFDILCDLKEKAEKNG